jgi:outer membrane protein assembly factor BamE (lipoprotein component of BamABCDE complex)
MGHAMRAVKLLAAAALLFVAGCQATFRDHGYIPPPEDLAEIEVGRDTRQTIEERVGPPTATGVLSDGGWYYVKSRFRNYAFRAPQEIDRQVLAVSFDKGGVVRNIERFGLENGRVVVLSRRVTDSNIRDIGFLRQLFGNLGQIAPEQFLE